MSREEYLANPMLVRLRQSFSLLDMKRFVDGRGCERGGPDRLYCHGGCGIGGHTEIVLVLIEAGADVNAKATDSSTAMKWAAQEGHTETVNILKQAGAQAGASNADLIVTFFLIVALIIFGISARKKRVI